VIVTIRCNVIFAREIYKPWPDTRNRKQKITRNNVGLCVCERERERFVKERRRREWSPSTAEFVCVVSSSVSIWNSEVLEGWTLR
jgi:hypothetical protein